MCTVPIACTRGRAPCRMAVHMDCLHWVNRDSYLPQGSRGLKVGSGPQTLPVHARPQGPNVSALGRLFNLLLRPAMSVGPAQHPWRAP